MDPERDPWPSVDDTEREMCPMCEALPTEPHGSHCPLYLPLCPECQCPTKHDGYICQRCKEKSLKVFA